MRSFLLVIATATALYIAYYLTVYTDLFNRSAPKIVLTPVQQAPATPAPAIPVSLPTSPTPTVDLHDDIAPAMLSEPAPTTSEADQQAAANLPSKEISETLALIHEGGDQALHHGITEIFSQQRTDEERRLITSALQKKYRQHFTQAMHTHLQNHLETLQSDGDFSNINHQLIFLSKFHDEFSKEQKQLFWNMILDNLRQNNAAEETASLRGSLETILKKDAFYEPLAREAADQEPNASVTQEWLKSLLKNAPD